MNNIIKPINPNVKYLISVTSVQTILRTSENYFSKPFKNNTAFSKKKIKIIPIKKKLRIKR